MFSSALAQSLAEDGDGDRRPGQADVPEQALHVRPAHHRMTGGRQGDEVALVVEILLQSFL